MSLKAIPPQKKNKSKSRCILIGGCGCFLVLCLLLGLAGVYYYARSSRGGSKAPDQTGGTGPAGGPSAPVKATPQGQGTTTNPGSSSSTDSNTEKRTFTKQQLLDKLAAPKVQETTDSEPEFREFLEPLRTVLESMNAGQLGEDELLEELKKVCKKDELPEKWVKFLEEM